MPYSGQADTTLPDAVKKLPKRLGAIWVKTFNATLDETEDEGQAAKLAWTAVRKATDAKPGPSAKVPDKPSADAFGGKKAPAFTKGKSIALFELADEVVHEFQEQFGNSNPDMGSNYADTERELFVEAVYDDHVIARERDQLYKVPYTVVKNTAADGNTESVNAVKFAARSQWTPVVRTYTAVKALTQADGRKRWLGISSGSYEDREHEVVSSALLESAVKECDRTGDRGKLWVHHVPGTEVGDCDFQAFVDGFLVESGLMHTTPAGLAATHYLETRQDDAAMSLQFAYKQLTADGVYMPPGMILERSILPIAAAAFPWSGIALTELSTMTTISEEKRAALNEILGEDIAGQVLANLSVNAKALSGAGVRYKEIGAGSTALVAEPPVAVGQLPTEPTEAEAEADEAEVQASLDSMVGVDVTTPEPVEYFELSDAALDQLVEKITARMGLIGTDNIPGIVEKSFHPLSDQIGALRTVVEALAADVARFGESDDARIAEKAANTSKATMRRILRPTQAKSLDESAIATPSDDADLLKVGEKTLHG